MDVNDAASRDELTCATGYTEELLLGPLLLVVC